MDINKILSKLQIEDLNPMQQESVLAILRTYDDVVILSPTGSGKTLAYLLPLLELVSQVDQRDMMAERGPIAVVVVPGRELALQSVTVMRDLGTGLRAMALYGGRPAMDEHRQLRQVKPHVVFVTPGRFNDHVFKENISTLFVKYLVIDEFDKCLAMGFQDEMKRLIGYLRHLERRILLSATDAEEIPRFVDMSHVQRLDYRVEEEQVPKRVEAYVVRSTEKDKLATLRALLLDCGDQSSVVFLNYRDSVERTAKYLREQGFTVSVFHGGMEQDQREAQLYRFSNGSANVLVCTDLASRGLDIPDIQNIIHYHIPLGQEGYIHRVGRTARWDKAGNTYFILGPSEFVPDYIQGASSMPAYELKATTAEDGQIPAVPSPRMVTIYIGKGKKDKISKGDIVGFLCKSGNLTSEDIGRIDVKERYSYVAVSREKVTELLQNVAGEKIKGIKTVVEVIK